MAHDWSLPRSDRLDFDDDVDPPKPAEQTELEKMGLWDLMDSVQREAAIAILQDKELADNCDIRLLDDGIQLLPRIAEELVRKRIRTLQLGHIVTVDRLPLLFGNPIDPDGGKIDSATVK